MIKSFIRRGGTLGFIGFVGMRSSAFEARSRDRLKSSPLISQELTIETVRVDIWRQRESKSWPPLVSLGSPYGI